MLDYDSITEVRADRIMPGDIFDTHCGVADYAWKTVLSVRYIDRPAPLKDRVEITLDTDAMCPTRELSVDSLERVIPGVRP
jgi:hypothetical protein